MGLVQPSSVCEGWIWAGISLWFHTQGRAAEQQNVLLMLSLFPFHPGHPQPVLPSHNSSSGSAQACLAHGDPILEFQAESGFHSRQHMVPQFPLPQKHVNTFSGALKPLRRARCHCHCPRGWLQLGCAFWPGQI